MHFIPKPFQKTIKKYNFKKKFFAKLSNKKNWKKKLINIELIINIIKKALRQIKTQK